MSKFLFTIFISISAPCILSAQTLKSVYLENRLTIPREDELVIIKRDVLEKGIGNIDPKKYIILFKNNVPLVVQHDDFNNDGKWDEICFTYSFSPLEKAELKIGVDDSPSAVKAKVMANVGLRKNNSGIYDQEIIKEVMPLNNPANDFTKNPLPLYQAEGPAWENDKVAFRLYFDMRNGKDVFGKTTDNMMMDTVGKSGDKFYHSLDEAWGMDILKVGKSLGAGGLAVLIPQFNGKDTLIRVGGPNVGKTTYKKVAGGPVRAVFKLYYDKWNILGDGKKAELTEEISISAGKYFYDSKIKMEDFPPGTRLVTGIVNLQSKKLNEIEEGDTKVIYTFDKQSANNDNLGLAILAKTSFSPVTALAPVANSDVMNTYTLSLDKGDGKGIKYRFYAGWQRSNPQFATEEAFTTFLKNEAAKYNLSIKVSWL